MNHPLDAQYDRLLLRAWEAGILDEEEEIEMFKRFSRGAIFRGRLAARHDELQRAGKFGKAN